MPITPPDWHAGWESLKRYTHIQPKHVLEKLAKPR